jgi:hypothetical protein
MISKVQTQGIVATRTARRRSLSFQPWFNSGETSPEVEKFRCAVQYTNPTKQAWMVKTAAEL